MGLVVEKEVGLDYVRKQPSIEEDLGFDDSGSGGESLRELNFKFEYKSAMLGEQVWWTPVLFSLDALERMFAEEVPDEGFFFLSKVSISSKDHIAELSKVSPRTNVVTLKIWDHIAELSKVPFITNVATLKIWGRITELQVGGQVDRVALAVPDHC